jgi:hypothetical protein
LIPIFLSDIGNDFPSNNPQVEQVVKSRDAVKIYEAILASL